MSREIRRVPQNWQHPKAIYTHFYPGKGYLTKEKYRPMYQRDHGEAVIEWKKELDKWITGSKLWQDGYYINYGGKKQTKQEVFDECLKHIEEDRAKHNFGSDYRQEEKMKYQTGSCSYSDLVGEAPRYPDPEDYMPVGEWYQLFETVSEGTPITPPFPTPHLLVVWLSTNKDYWGEQWTREQAEGILKLESVPSFITSNNKILSSREIAGENND